VSDVNQPTEEALYVSELDGQYEVSVMKVRDVELADEFEAPLVVRFG
jgi:hypothetical protein